MSSCTLHVPWVSLAVIAPIDKMRAVYNKVDGEMRDPLQLHRQTPAGYRGVYTSSLSYRILLHPFHAALSHKVLDLLANCTRRRGDQSALNLALLDAARESGSDYGVSQI
jgi:hypothetical protein